jgi:hypothetical protein
VANFKQPVESDDEITWSDVRNWLEVGSWSVLAIVPFLYWVNGPAVSEDQFVVRTTFVLLAACSAIGLRAFDWFCRHRP